MEPPLLLQSKAESPLPDPPKKLQQCFRKKLPTASSADQKVRHLYAQAEERGICGTALLKWYSDIKKAREQKT